MKRFGMTACAVAAAGALGGAALVASGEIIVYEFMMDGPSESPPVPSDGTGTATVTFDTTLSTMRVQASFMDLEGAVSLCHIHTPTMMPLAGTAGVATTLPTFPGFPAGVMAGSYDMTFNMLMASSYNASYVTANGGTTAGAFAALVLQASQGRAYLNIHTSFAGGGEIRGFLVLAGPTCPADLDGTGGVGASDLALLLGGWGMPGPADFNESGGVDSGDLASLLGSWGDCP